MKGIFHLRPPQPHYTTTWDVNIVLSFLNSWVPHYTITLKELTLKTVALVALISGLRAQSIHNLDTLLMQRSEDCITFTCRSLSKQAKTGLHQSPLKIYRYTEDADLYAFSVVSFYFNRTYDLRTSSTFWISFQKPQVAVRRQTTSRWLKAVLHMSGIDTPRFSGHSTRMASTSKANTSGVGLTSILKTASWSKATIFKKSFTFAMLLKWRRVGFLLREYLIPHNNWLVMLFSLPYLCYHPGT